MDSFSHDSILPIAGAEIPYHVFRRILSFFPRLWEISKENAIEPTAFDSLPDAIDSQQHEPSIITYIHTLGSVCSGWRNACLASLGSIVISSDLGFLPSVYPPICLQFATALILTDSNVRLLKEEEFRLLVERQNPSLLRRLVVHDDDETARIVSALGWAADPVPKSELNRPYSSFEGPPAPEASIWRNLISMAQAAVVSGKKFEAVESVFEEYAVSMHRRPPSLVLEEGEIDLVETTFPSVRSASLIADLLTERLWSESLQTINLVRVSGGGGGSGGVGGESGSVIGILRIIMCR